MRFHTSTTASVASAVVLGVSLGACAQATTSSSTAGDSFASAGASAGAWVSNVSERVVSLFESQTVSSALDRIDQRGPQPNNRYQRRGTGAGVTVYVFDGGVSDDHPELAGRVRRGFSAFPGDEPICNSHGTAVAGAIGGLTLGVAPEVDIVDVKMVECGRLRGTIQGIVDATRWVLGEVLQHPERRAIANWSFIADTGAIVPALDSAVAALTQAGVPVIVSAGNIETNACRVSPANSPGSIVVGSTTYGRDGIGRLVDRRAPGTAFGPCIDVYAPGDSVMLPSLDQQQGHSAQLWNGTSMAAGYVSGAAALYLEANPSASPEELSVHLKKSGTQNIIVDSRSPFSFMLYVGEEERGRREPMRVTVR